MIESREVFVLQLWFPSRNEWMDITALDSFDLAEAAVQAGRLLCAESKFRCVRRFAGMDGAQDLARFLMH